MEVFLSVAAMGLEIAAGFCGWFPAKLAGGRRALGVAVRR
jgi:hypothetical protein